MRRAIVPALSLLSVGCEADLEQSCFKGPCGEEANVVVVAVADTGDYPVEVFEILRDQCHRCHTEPPRNGAPFPLLTVDDAEAPYCQPDAEGVCEVVEPQVPRWQRMQLAVEPGATPQMPFGLPPLPDGLLDPLRAWFATCEQGACARSVEEP